MTRAKGKKRLNLASHVRESGAFRGVKIVMPECQIAKAVQGKTEYTTGPCQQAVKDTPALMYTWFKTCTHGPSVDEDGNHIPPNLRPYYETNITVEKTPIVQEGVITEWQETPRYSARLRIRDFAWNQRIMGGFAVMFSQQRGGKDPAEFDIAPFCEMHGCFRQDVTQFKNGLFCTERHAKLVKATESNKILHIPWDQGNARPLSAERRQDELMEIEV